MQTQRSLTKPSLLLATRARSRMDLRRASALNSTAPSSAAPVRGTGVLGVARMAPSATIATRAARVKSNFAGRGSRWCCAAVRRCRGAPRWSATRVLRMRCARRAACLTSGTNRWAGRAPARRNQPPRPPGPRTRWLAVAMAAPGRSKSRLRSAPLRRNSLKQRPASAASCPFLPAFRRRRARRAMARPCTRWGIAGLARSFGRPAGVPTTRRVDIATSARKVR
mmetsp:Transcript_65711/g.189096  ORF Transcript_65711/g.189096 Transcript_65711/m.189096 type:complete len:224 (-) Transcript_65711:148-819(-)